MDRDSRPKVLVVSYEYPPLGGGGAKVVHGLLTKLIEQGMAADVVTMGFRGLPWREQKGHCRIFRVPGIRRDRSMCRSYEMIPYVLLALPILLWLVARNRYVINHTHFIFPDGVLSAVVKLVTGLPVVVTAHGSDVPGYNPNRFALLHRLLKPVWRVLTSYCDRIVCPSGFLRSLVRSHNPHARAVIVPNGIDVHRFDHTTGKDQRILCVSRLFERKGVQHVIGAVAEGNFTAWTTTVVGEGPYLDELRRTAGGRKNVQLVGFLDNNSERLKHLYETSAIFVLASSAENFPIVLLEAMIAGAAIVTTRGTGCQDVVGDAALLVPPEDPEALREALTRLMNDAPLRATLGRMARARAESLFSWQAVASAHRELYGEVVRLAGYADGLADRAPSTGRVISAPRINGHANRARSGEFERVTTPRVTARRAVNLRRTKVCFVVNEFFGWGKYGGFGSATRMIATGLAAKGMAVDVVTPMRQGQAPIERADGLTIRGFRAWSMRDQMAAYRASDADIYHSQDASIGTLLCQRAMPDRRHVVTCQDPRTWRDWSIELACYLHERRYKSLLSWPYEDNPLVWSAVRKADAVFSEAKHIVPKAQGKYSLKVAPQFLPNPVPLPNGPIRKADRPTVCFIGRFDKRKRPELFFELAKRCPDVQFIAIGAANSAHMDRILRQRYAAVPNLELTGFLDRFASPRFAEILSRSWILVNTAAREGLPVTFLEAASYRCAILSQVNPDEFASRFGYHAAAGDFAAGIETLLENDGWRARGEAAYDYVRTTHALDVVIERHLDAYASLMHTAARSRRVAHGSEPLSPIVPDEKRPSPRDLP